MKKEELQQIIKETLIITTKYDELMHQARDARYRYRPTYLKRSLLFLICTWYLWGTTEYTFSGEFVVRALSVNLIIGIPAYLMYRFLAFLRRQHSLKHSERLKEEADKFLEESLDNAKLPMIFCNTRTLNKFTYYIESHLAENLKECANLYHNEKQYEKLHLEIEILKWRMDQNESRKVPVTARNLSN